MSKIITSENRIIFDGHARTKDECETISLMCEELAKSDKFKTVKYDSGYAEFEKVGKATELRFPPDIAATITVNLDDSSRYGTIKINAYEASINKYSDFVYVIGNVDFTVLYQPFSSYTATLTVQMQSGYELDSVSFGSTSQTFTKSGNSYTVSFTQDKMPNTITLTSKQSTPTTPRKSVDLTTLPGWSSLSSGSHSITIVAKAAGYSDSEPSVAVSVTKETTQDPLVGTWVFNESLSGNSQWGNTKAWQDVYIDYLDVATHEKRTATVLSLDGANLETISSLNIDDVSVFENGSWVDEVCRTIVITEEPSENADGLLAWLQANATKVDELQGTWVFNDTLVGDFISYQSSTADVDFTCGEISYDELHRNYVLEEGAEEPAIDDLLYVGAGVTYSIVYQDGTWQDESYKTINFTSNTLDLMLASSSYAYSFLLWLQENATKQ